MFATRNSQKQRKSENVDPEEGYRIASALKIDRCDRVTKVKDQKRDRLVREKGLYEYGIDNLEDGDSVDPFSRGLRLALTSKNAQNELLEQEEAISNRLLGLKLTRKKTERNLVGLLRSCFEVYGSSYEGVKTQDMAWNRSVERLAACH